MIQFESASVLQQVVAIACVKAVLKCLNFEQHYELLKKEQGIRIQENPSYPPSPIQVKELETYLHSIKSLITVLKATKLVPMPTSGKMTKVSLFIISQIDDVVINQIIRMYQKSMKPTAYDDLVLDFLPGDMRSRWNSVVASRDAVVGIAGGAAAGVAGAAGASAAGAAGVSAAGAAAAFTAGAAGASAAGAAGASAAATSGKNVTQEYKTNAFLAARNQLMGGGAAGDAGDAVSKVIASRSESVDGVAGDDEDDDDSVLGPIPGKF